MLKNRQYGVIPYCLFFFKINGGGKINASMPLFCYYRIFHNYIV